MNKINFKSFPIILSLLVILLAIPLTAYLGNQRQEVRKKAQEIQGLAKDTVFGVGLIPVHYPNHTPQEIEDAFRLTQELGSHTGNIGQWRDYNLDITRILLNLSRQYGLKFIAGISPTTLDQDRCKVDAPAGVVPDFSNPATRNAFKNKVREIAALRPDGLALATEINYLEFCTDPQDRSQLNYFVSLYNEIYDELKISYPDLPIFVTYQYDELYDNNEWAIISRFKQDWIGLTSYPDRFVNPDQVPSNYYLAVNQYVGRRPVYFMEMGWPAQNSSQEEAQRRFVQRLPTLLSGINLRYITWSLLHDVTLFEGGLSPLNYVGLRYNNGSPKLSYEAAKNLVFPKFSTGKIVFKPLTDLREIWVANDDGSGIERMATGQAETYSPPALSPDGTKVAFQDGFVIKIINLNTKAVREVGSGGHADWSPDGRKLVYCEVEPEFGALEIWVMDNDGSHKTRIVPYPQDSEFCDPEWSPNGTKILFSGGGGDLGHGVYIIDINPDGTNPHNQRRLTNLDRRFSDHDGSWSPDSQNIVFERYEGPGPWHRDTQNFWSIFKVDLQGRETRLTPGNRGEVYNLPIFSPDGSKVMYSTSTESVPGFEWCLLPAFLMNLDSSNKYSLWGGTNILCTNFYDWVGANTPAITPTPTIPSTSVLAFKIKFQGVSVLRGGKQVRVTLKNGQTFTNVSVTSDNLGIYSGTISGIAPGTYEVLVKEPTHLQKNFGSVTFTAGQTITKDWSSFSLLAGDFNNDNRISIEDLGLVLSAYTQLSVPIPPGNPIYDVNFDNVISIEDIALPLANYTNLSVPGDN